jgi:hypothetical protein
MTINFAILTMAIWRANDRIGGRKPFLIANL